MDAVTYGLLKNKIEHGKSATDVELDKKLDKNQGTENSGKIAGIDESGDIVPMIPQGVTYNEETQCLEYGVDEKINLNVGIQLDDTLSKVGYAADAAKVGELKGDLDEFKESISDVTYSENLINPETTIYGISLDTSTGTETTSGQRTTTDFIEIDTNCNYGVYIEQYGKIFTPSGVSIYFYDEGKNFISLVALSFNYDEPKAEITSIPSNAKYLRICFVDTNGGYVKSTMLIKGDTVPSAFIAYFKKVDIKEDAIPSSIARKTDVDNMQEKVDSVKIKYEMTNYMLFVDKYNNKKYVDGAMTDTNYWQATSMVKLDRNYDMYSPAVNGNVVFFDENKEYISTVEFKYNLPVKKSAYPDNAVYVAFSYQTNYMQSYNNVMYVTRTDNYILSTRKFYPTTKKEVGKRPIINIYTTDSQDTILWKLADAFLTRNCDVYFENGTYVFDDVFVDLYEKYSYRAYFELPIGGNCRYYFNGSTLICNTDKFYEKYSGTVDLLSCTHSTTSESYELYDGTLINNGGIYTVHDECGSKPNWYSHKYKNMHLIYNTLTQTNNIRKPIGGGTGLFGESVFENCIFETDHTFDLSFHGISSEKEDIADFKLVISNCYLSKGLSLDPLGINQTASLIMNGCSAKSIPSTSTNGGGYGWNVISWGNEKRTD